MQDPLIANLNMTDVTNSKPKIIVCYADAGGGHKSVANAINECIASNYQKDLDIEIANIAKDYGDFLLNNMGKVYSILIKRFPLVWELGFVKFYTKFPLMGEISLRIAWFRYGKYIKKFIDNNPADAYISTIHLYGYFLSKYRNKTKKDFKIITVVTDISYLGFFWLDKHHDLIILPTEECSLHGKKLIKKYKVEPVLKILGLPINEAYYKRYKKVKTTKNNKKEIRVLVATGGEGSNDALEICKSIDKIYANNISLEVSVGKNTKLAEKINTFKWKKSIKAFGWIPSLVDKYRDIDIVITKAGPTTIWECMALDKPMIIYSYIKGQEDGNPEFALKRCRAIYEKDFRKISSLIQTIAKSGVNKSFPYPENYSKEYATINWTAKVCKEIVNFTLNNASKQ